MTQSIGDVPLWWLLVGLLLPQLLTMVGIYVTHRLSSDRDEKIQSLTRNREAEIQATITAREHLSWIRQKRAELYEDLFKLTRAIEATDGTPDHIIDEIYVLSNELTPRTDLYASDSVRTAWTSLLNEQQSMHMRRRDTPIGISCGPEKDALVEAYTRFYDAQNHLTDVVRREIQHPTQVEA